MLHKGGLWQAGMWVHPAGGARGHRFGRALALAPQQRERAGRRLDGVGLSYTALTDAAGRRVTTSLFRSHGPPYLSVGLQVVLDEVGEPPDVMLQGYEGHGLAAILVGVIRAPDLAARPRNA